MTTPTRSPAAAPTPPPAETPTTPPRPAGLADLSTLELTPENQRALAQASADALGPPAWQQRKRAEAHGLIALSQIAPRLSIRHLDMRTDLVVLIELRDTPVPCLSPGEADIRIERTALLAIDYPQEIISHPIPGTRPIRVLAPSAVFHSNVAYGIPMPPLCLGASVPRGYPLREMALASYGALTLQAISLDNLDPAGVLNAEAAVFWQANAKRIPLTTEPFLGWRGAERAPLPPALPAPEDHS